MQRSERGVIGSRSLLHQQHHASITGSGELDGLRERRTASAFASGASISSTPVETRRVDDDALGTLGGSRGTRDVFDAGGAAMSPSRAR